MTCSDSALGEDNKDSSKVKFILTINQQGLHNLEPACFPIYFNLPYWAPAMLMFILTCQSLSCCRSIVLVLPLVWKVPPAPNLTFVWLSHLYILCLKIVSFLALPSSLSSSLCLFLHSLKIIFSDVFVLFSLCFFLVLFGISDVRTTPD